MLQDLREIMGLTIEQVADELSLSADQVSAWEKVDDPQYSLLFFAAYPVNRAVLRHPGADPFLSSYDQTSPGRRLERWMLENGVSASALSARLSTNVEWVLGFVQGTEGPLTKAQGEMIQERTGINRKWLMYGDGRNRGSVSPALRKRKEDPTDQSSSLFEKMAADFQKLPDRKIKTREEEKREKKELGLQVREARKAAGLSIREAAEVLQISASRVGQLECGIITEKRAREVLGLIRAHARQVGSPPAAVEKAEEGPVIKSEPGLIWGEKIREARKKAGFSQQGVGNLIRMSHASVSLMEKGRVSEEKAREVLEVIERAAGKRQGS